MVLIGMPDHLLDKPQMQYPQRAARYKRGKQCHGFKKIQVVIIIGGKKG